MKLWQVTAVSILLFGLVSGAEVSKTKKTKGIGGKIVGGDALEYANLPYQVSFSMLHKGSIKHFCGGSVIGPRTVLTAAHCLDKKKVSDLYIRTGSTVVDEGGTLNKVYKFYKHPKYNSKSNINNDLAVLIMVDPIKDAMAVSLAEEDPAAGTIALISGWGLQVEKSPDLSKYLKSLWIPVVDRNVCRKQYRLFNDVSKDMICIGYPEGKKSACQGDSGGPLVIGTKQAGVASWAQGCARAGKPSVYASVPENIEWIRQYIQ